MARPEGFEPTALCFGGTRSIHLSYGRAMIAPRAGGRTVVSAIRFYGCPVPGLVGGRAFGIVNWRDVAVAVSFWTQVPAAVYINPSHWDSIFTHTRLILYGCGNDSPGQARLGTACPTIGRFLACLKLTQRMVSSA
jgi:hypothetical protein